MQKISIVKMKKEDVGAVFEIEKLVHPNHHWSKDSFYNEISNNLAHYYCAKNEDGIILAYLGVWHIFEEAHITTLAVHPEFRGLQLAQAIMIKAVDDCYKNMVK